MMDSRGSSSIDSRLAGPALLARVGSYEASENKCISDVRRTFCLFVTFDLLFITLLWIIELNVRHTSRLLWVHFTCGGKEFQRWKITALSEHCCPRWRDHELSFLWFVWQVNGGIQKELKKEVLHYNYHDSFFDIFVSQSLTLMVVFSINK